MTLKVVPNVKIAMEVRLMMNIALVPPYLLTVLIDSSCLYPRSLQYLKLTRQEFSEFYPKYLDDSTQSPPCLCLYTWVKSLCNSEMVAHLLVCPPALDFPALWIG